MGLWTQGSGDVESVLGPASTYLFYLPLVSNLLVLYGQYCLILSHIKQSLMKL